MQGGSLSYPFFYLIIRGGPLKIGKTLKFASARLISENLKFLEREDESKDIGR